MLRRIQLTWAVSLPIMAATIYIHHHICYHYHHHNRFTALFPEPRGWARARRELLDFMLQGKINRGRYTDHLAGRHSIRINQCPPPSSPHIFYRPDALPAAQPTASKHWRQCVEAVQKLLLITSAMLASVGISCCHVSQSVCHKSVFY